ncbi:MAG: hypothetical protein CUN56_08990 [Phototrophicales bacterium]|nr:MAG: hypothetical protein CUN56_08990 [Phototrophicales bacterium]RMG74697.1 MAG: RNA polymerase sigma factor [Chloroflexota bacterium]
MSEEHTLLIQARTGDTFAFDQLHLMVAPAITRFVRRLVGDGQHVEDIVQDVFLTLFKNLEAIDPPEKLRPYLFRVARHRCYDLLRKQGRYNIVSLDDEPVHVRVSFTSQRHTPPDEAAHWLLLQMEVQEAIDRLPEHQRQTLILYSEAELSYAEIADVMDVSIGTVKSRLFHAKKNLRGLLHPETLLAIMQELGDQSTEPEIIKSP